MILRVLLRVALAAIVSLLMLVCLSFSESKVTVAFLDGNNVFGPVQKFDSGFELSGQSGAITVTAPSNVNSYTLTLPSSGGQAGSYLCVGSVAGQVILLAHCPNSGAGAPLVGTSPSSVSFGTIPTGSTTQSYVIITNVGNALMTFSNPPFTFTGTPSFSIPSAPQSTCSTSTTLAGGSSCTLFLNFVASQGVNTGTLNIYTNAFLATGTPATVALTGTGQ